MPVMHTSGRTVPGPCCRSAASSLSCSSAATRWAAAHVDDGAWAWAVRQRCARSCAVRVATMLLRSCREVSADEGLCCCCCCRSPRCCRMNVALLLFRAAADRTAPMRGRMLRATGRAAEAADAFACKNVALRTMKAIYRHITESECLSAPNEFQLNLTVRYSMRPGRPCWYIVLSALFCVLMQKSRAWAVVRHAVKNKRYLDGESEEAPGWEDAATPLLSALRRLVC